MTRGRKPNYPRNEARIAGLKVYHDPNPCWCGCDLKYTVNAQCVECLIAKGKSIYAALDGDALDERKANDRRRYVERRVRQGHQVS